MVLRSTAGSRASWANPKSGRENAASGVSGAPVSSVGALSQPIRVETSGRVRAPAPAKPVTLRKVLLSMLCLGMSFEFEARNP